MRGFPTKTPQQALVCSGNAASGCLKASVIIGLPGNRHRQRTLVVERTASGVSRFAGLAELAAFAVLAVLAISFALILVGSSTESNDVFFS